MELTDLLFVRINKNILRMLFFCYYVDRMEMMNIPAFW